MGTCSGRSGQVGVLSQRPSEQAKASTIQALHYTKSRGEYSASASASTKQSLSSPENGLEPSLCESLPETPTMLLAPENTPELSVCESLPETSITVLALEAQFALQESDEGLENHSKGRERLLGRPPLKRQQEWDRAYELAIGSCDLGRNDPESNHSSAPSLPKSGTPGLFQTEILDSSLRGSTKPVEVQSSSTDVTQADLDDFESLHITLRVQQE
ncbi:MAG: hypothetical protein Q9190_002524 [Brigantiaea leucoxantha]